MVNKDSASNFNFKQGGDNRIEKQSSGLGNNESAKKLSYYDPDSKLDIMGSGDMQVPEESL